MGSSLSDEEFLAYHEAGHAVVAWTLGLPVGDVYARKDGRRERRRTDRLRTPGVLDLRRHIDHRESNG